MSSEQEVQDPAVEIGSSGYARTVVRVFPSLDTATIRVSFILKLRSRTDITRIHIHNAASGANGPVAVSFFDVIATPDRDPKPIRTQRFLTFVAIKTDVDVETARAIMESPEDYYYNIHTAAFPAGEVRGQLLEF